MLLGVRNIFCGGGANIQVYPLLVVYGTQTTHKGHIAQRQLHLGSTLLACKS